MKSIEIEPTRTAYTNTGLAHFHKGRYAEAAAMQEKAAELAPGDYRVWGRLGEALHAQGGADEKAAKAFSKAVPLALERLEINPRDWRTRAYLSTFHAWLGEPAEAEKQVSQALVQSSRHPEALLCAADVAYAGGDIESYLSLLEEMVGKDPAYAMFIDERSPELQANPRWLELRSLAQPGG